jgi:NitT/TauT family transport system permease protein
MSAMGFPNASQTALTEHGRAGLRENELPPPKATPAKRNVLREYGPPVFVFVGFLGVWCVVHKFFLASYRQALLPYPWDVITHGFTEKGEPKNPGELLGALTSTIRTSIGGLLLAIVIGTVLAVIMSRAAWIEKATYPYAVALQTIPIIALVPLFYVFTGSGYMSRTLVCVLIAVFPIIVNTLFGLKSPDPGMHDLFTLHGANTGLSSKVRKVLGAAGLGYVFLGGAALLLGWISSGQVFGISAFLILAAVIYVLITSIRLRKLEFPAALPAMFEGYRISAGLSVIGAIVSEIYFKDGPRGLGGIINLYNNRGWYPQMYAAIFITSLYGLVVFALFGALRNLVIGKWHNTKR